jgi:DNA-binding protein Fis
MKMDTTTIRKQLHDYIEVAEDKKVQAIYTMVEDEINEPLQDYSPEYKAELDERVNHYLTGGKMVSGT